MDKIIISDLEVWYCVGVPDEERAVAQRLLLSIEMFLDFSQAVATDDLTKTIDYFAVTQQLLAFGTGRSWKLIEKLAEDISAMVLTDYAAHRVAVEVKKFIIPETKYVAVRIERSPKK